MPQVFQVGLILISKAAGNGCFLGPGTAETPKFCIPALFHARSATMGKRWQERNGIAIPVESREQETPAVASVYVQQGLVQDQLPRYLASLIEAGAAIEAVFRQSFGGIVASSRFSVVYRHTEELGTEVFC